MLYLGIVVFAFFISCAMTWGLRLYAIKNNVIDQPNQRSSHSVPTPRGGGVAIVLTLLAALLWLVLTKHISHETFLGFFVPGLLIAVIGFLDDHGHIAARWRLLMHFLAAAIGLYFLGTFPDIDIFGYVVSLSWFGIIIGSVYLVWMLNLYNFMDGINGLASSHAITFSLCSVVIITLSQNAGSPDCTGSRWGCRRIHCVELPCGKDLHGGCWKWFFRYYYWPDDSLFCKARFTCLVR